MFHICTIEVNKLISFVFSGTNNVCGQGLWRIKTRWDGNSAIFERFTLPFCNNLSCIHFMVISCW